MEDEEEDNDNKKGYNFLTSCWKDKEE